VSTTPDVEAFAKVNGWLIVDTLFCADDPVTLLAGLMPGEGHV
jgi:hypothetical protein